MNIAADFARQARRTPAALALSWDAHTLAYGELHDAVRRAAALFAARGVEADDRIAILLPNDPAFAVALLGAHWLGAVAAVLSPVWTATDAARALADADARLLVTTEALAQAIGAPSDTTICIDDAGAWPTIVSDAPAPGSEPVQRAANDAATILYSSGTTGEPKGVVLTHGNLLFNARAKIRCCGITPADRLAMVVPMAHCFGQNVVLFGALLAGASVRIHPRFDAARTSREMATGDVTMLLAAPTAFARLLALGDERGLRRLRYALTAAAPLPADLAAAWHDATERPLCQGYGLTESSPFATYDDGTTGDGAVGTAISGVELRVAALDGDGWAREGESGEVSIRGPNVMQGYWRHERATADVLRDGWLRTGDIGWLSDGGRLHLADRIDDVINVAGFKAWPSDVERVLTAHPAVHEAAAYAVPHATRGSAVAAAIVAAPDATLDLAVLYRWAGERLAGFQRPALLHAVPALPRSPTGKVLRRTLAAGHRAAHGSADQGAIQVAPANADRDATGRPDASR